MKRVEREVNRITSAIIGTALRVLLVVVIAFLVCEGAAKGYRFGYRIFVPPEQIGTAVTKTIVVEEGEPLLEIAENLEKEKLIWDKYAFCFTAKFYSSRVLAGSYELDSSMKPKEILDIMAAGDGGGK